MTTKALMPAYMDIRVARRGDNDFVAYGHADLVPEGRTPPVEGRGATWDAALADLLRKLGFEL